MVRVKALPSASVLLASLLALPSCTQQNELASRGTDRLVFCHFMIGIVADRTSAADFDADMQRAKALGIDAFALNIGVDPYTDTQLGYAYQSAADNDMKVFISFDFNWYTTSQGTAVGQEIAKYADLPAQLIVDGKVFASSFAGDGVDVSAIRSAAGRDIFWAPNFHPGSADFSEIDAALNWLAWPNNGDNKAPTAVSNVTVQDGDDAYIAELGSLDKYIAPVSAWFSTHYGPEVSYSKNFVFPSDLLWYNRWNEILSLGPRFLEIITWNDYGESHYIGPLSSPHYDDGNSKWTNDMPHDGWLDVSKPFIEAFKDGETSAASYVTADELVYWYRPTLRTINCDDTDTTLVPANNDSGNYFEGRPNGYESLADAVFVVAMLTEAGTVTVQSGTNIQEFDAPKGISAYQVDMNVGTQQFFLARNGETVLAAQSLKDVTNVCPCGIYNFNAYVGTVPESAPDRLQPDALNSLTVGLHVRTCSATPSLGTVAIAPTSTPPLTVGSSSRSSSAVSSTSLSTSTRSSTSPTITTTMSTSTISSTSVTSSTTTSVPTGTCNAGTGDGNYLGLCDFACHFGYCPPGPCLCTSYGQANTPPPETGTNGVPLDGEDDSYLGLCSFDCNHGYCPDTACQVVS